MTKARPLRKRASIGPSGCPDPALGQSMIWMMRRVRGSITTARSFTTV